MSQSMSLGRFDLKGSHHFAHKTVQSRRLLPDSRKWVKIFEFVQTKIRPGLPPQYVLWRPRFIDIFRNKIGLEDSDQWVPERPLGRGSYGAVALFHKKDSQGQIVDSVVLKTAQATPRHGLPRKMDISKEAWNHYQFNELHCESVLRLRNFKYMLEDHQWRYYLENAPSGDLERLRCRYKAWGMYLPELFLWYVFRCLVEGCTAMEAGVFRDYNDNFIPDSFMLHCDIKPQNIIAGHPSTGHGSLTSEYPIPKIADFGLAVPTVLDGNDKQNLPAFLQAGTPLYQPPEIRFLNEKKVDSFWRPFGPRQPDLSVVSEPMYNGQSARDTYRIGPEANLWAIANVMYSLTTLEEPETLYRTVQRILTEQLSMDSCYNIIPPIRTQQAVYDREYSGELLDLIRSCLRLDPEDRPTLRDLRVHINKGMEKHVRGLIDQYKYDPVCWEAATRVYHVDNEINELPMGPYAFKYSSGFIRDWQERAMWDDPDWGDCVPHWQRPGSQLVNHHQLEVPPTSNKRPRADDDQGEEPVRKIQHQIEATLEDLDRRRQLDADSRDSSKDADGEDVEDDDMYG